jgi:Zn-dependent protease with chaperone function
MPYRLLFCWLTVLCCRFPIAAQTQSGEFSPVKEDSILLRTLRAQYQQQYKQDLDRLPSLNRKDYQELYSDRWKNIQQKFDGAEIYTAAPAQQYLDGLLARIVNANPNLAQYVIRCYFSRSYIPNAEYIGEGIILVNMGLFERLHNESEAAFVVCHEIAHCILRHQENSMAKYVAAINSDETQAVLRKVKYTEYRKKDQLEHLVKEMAFDSRRHSRDHEAQADSMGVELMRHTGFDLRGSLTTLELLDGIDKLDFDMKACLQQVFNAREYPFRAKWLNEETGLLGGHARLRETELSDSLKTHPACKQRIAALTALVLVSSGGRAYITDSLAFLALQERFRYEVIEYAYASDEYSESLFIALQLLGERPGDAWLVAHIGRLLNGLYAAEKGHRLSKVADLPSPEYPANYDLLLQFIQNLHREDLAAVSYYFLLPWHPKLDGNYFFKAAFEESARIVRE